MGSYDETVDDTFSSPFFKAADIPPQGLTVEIEAVDFQIFGKAPNQEKKPILSFIGEEKQLVLNKTNAKAIAKAVGSQRYADWPGRSITLVSAIVDFKGDAVEAVRVKSAANL